MKRIISFLIAALTVVSLSGCGYWSYSSRSSSQKLYEKTVTDLLSALDAGDGEAIFNMFGAEAKADADVLKAGIDRMLSVYEGPHDGHGCDYRLAESESVHYGEYFGTANDCFPVRCEDTYYYIRLEIVYESTADESLIGISELAFYTEDEYYIFRSVLNRKWPDSSICVMAEAKCDFEVRTIEGYPRKYSQNGDPISLSDVKEHIKENWSLAEFQKRFGQPDNDDSVYLYYELESEDGKQKYLKLSASRTGGITYASVVDDFFYVETVWKAEYETKNDNVAEL